MTQAIILASGSEIRHQLLKNAGVVHDVIPTKVDEDTIRLSLAAEGAGPREIADALADEKARKVSVRNPDALVIGCDQVLDLGGEILAKPIDTSDAATQISRLSGNRHMLISAAVIYESATPIWRHIGVVRLQMHKISETYCNEYVDRNWHSIRHSAGAYKLEEEGARLMARIDGDYFNVLGLPLLEILSYLSLRGVLPR